MFASCRGKKKRSRSVSSPCKKAVFILIEFIFNSLWTIKVSTKHKPLEHVDESLRISDFCSSKPLTTKCVLGIYLSSVFFIAQTHLQLSNGWSDLATSIQRFEFSFLKVLFFSILKATFVNYTQTYFYVYKKRTISQRYVLSKKIFKTITNFQINC